MAINFPKIEKKILKFWKVNKIFEKSIKQRAKSNNFVFYEGPPYANALPGIHHFLARALKDIICRYKTMQGFKVLRKAGWDTHGLPTEMEVEKKLGIRTKKEIEKLGIKKFTEECKKNVFTYKKEWEKFTERIGHWLDLENPYVTCENDYIESVWWIVQQIYQRGLLYKDYKVVPYCPRCGTSLSSHEAAQGYKKIKEPAIYIKLKIKDLKFKNSYLLVWTTTPWTLPGNVAVAVNPNFTYARVKVNNENLILAKERIEVCGSKGEIIQEFRGKDLLGLEYEPLFPVESLTERTYYLIAGDFVSLEEGTGLVHIAPAFGEEDMAVGKEKNLPVILNVDEEGKFKKSVKKWAGIYVKEADPLIILNLKKRGLLFKEEKYLHDYPFCWRCSSPLLYYAKQSWFINMQKVKKELIRNNQKINWIPSHLKEGRFGEWLREIKDWAFSRERYWGTPLSIWQCKKCKRVEVIGGKQNLANQKFTSNRYFILRHGQSRRNVDKIVACWPEKVLIPLTKKGKSQIKEVAKKLKKKRIDLIFSSDLLRTKQTAEIISEELGIKPKFDKRIRELNLGTFNGQPIEKTGRFWDPERKLSRVEYYLKRFKIKAPKGESWLDSKKRMYQFLKEIDRKYQNKNILIISHENPITMLEGAAKGFSREEIIKYRDRSHIRVGELRKLDFKLWPYNHQEELDFHRPYIDEVRFLCPQCQNLMERVPEVIDCWFDSGSMPFAQYHYPFENQELHKEQFPADYISEAIDQTRGWFYTLLAISTLLDKGPAYKNVISVGHVLDEKGEKMSKSKGNVVKPWPIVEKYGADATRWYFFTVNQPGDAKLFKEMDIEEGLKRFLITFWNCYTFFETYGIKPKTHPPAGRLKSRNILDKWIISKLNGLILDATNYLNKYDVAFAARAIENFIIEDFSQWYIRRSRKRFQGPETKKELKEASETLNYVLISEEVYKSLIKKGSVHLEDWPKTEKKLLDKELEEKMRRVREIVNLGLKERARLGIKVRQPLRKLTVGKLAKGLDPELIRLIKEELNVKSLRHEITLVDKIKLDETITVELKEEGMIREVIRQIQEMRKKAGYKPRRRILVRYSGTPNLNKILNKNKNFIRKEAKVKNFRLGKKPKQVFDIEREIKVDSQTLWLAIKKF
jgi:isoleucyl-tRNA synthetase